MIASAGYVQALLAREGLRPNKNLGQNFFIDGERLQRLLSPVELEGRPVLEIGPGLGALTEVLLSRGARVWAVEKDPRMAALLREALSNHSALTILEGDCLKTDYGFLPPGYVAAGNLPYCITTPIVEMLLAMEPEEMLLMMQKEAADRFFTRPGEKNYGPVAMVSALYYESRLLGEIPEGAYLPPPAVKSALVQLIRRPDAPPESPAALLRFGAQCLHMRRKTLYNNLSAFPQVPEHLESMGLPPGIRGEKLSPRELLTLYRLLEKQA